MKPSREFDGIIGMPSINAGGPDAIEYDLDKVFKMFDPSAKHTTGETGGIGTENIQPNSITDTLIGTRTLDQNTGVTATNTGTLTYLLSAFVTLLKAVKGTPNWYSSSPKSLMDLDNDIQANESDIETKVSALTSTVNANKTDIETKVTSLQGPGRTIETVKGTYDQLQSHVTGGDHDSRYIKVLDVDSKITAHEAGTSHDTRYYPRFEIDNKLLSLGFEVVSGVYTATINNTTTFTIPASTHYAPATDSLELYYQGVLLDSTNYTTAGSTVNLTFSINAGESILYNVIRKGDFTAFENLNADKLDGAHLSDIYLELGGSGRTTQNIMSVNTALINHDQDAVKHVTASERTTWNNKASTSVVTTSTNGLMTAADKTKLDGLNAANYAPLSATANVNGKFDTSTTAPTGTQRMNYSGYLYATRVYNAVFNDFAEWFLLDEEAEAGDILVMNMSGNGYIKSNEANSKVAVGVYSDTYGYCMGGDGLDDEEQKKTHAPVGLLGRVYVKVTGKARRGQYIVTSNIKGVGKATSILIHGTVIGIADENKDTLDIGRVRMFITRL